MDFVLRPNEPGDRDLFFESRREGFRAYAEQAFGPWDDPKQRASAETDFDELPIEIIERDGSRVGCQIILPEGDHVFLDEIVVVAGVRSHGLGTRLVTAIMDATHAQGLPLRLSVLNVNPAQRLYERLGFRVTRVEPPRIKMEWP